MVEFSYSSSSPFPLLCYSFLFLPSPVESPLFCSLVTSISRHFAFSTPRSGGTKKVGFFGLLHGSANVNFADFGRARQSFGAARLRLGGPLEMQMVLFSKLLLWHFADERRRRGQSRYILVARSALLAIPVWN